MSNKASAINNPPVELSAELKQFIDHLVRAGYISDVKITDETVRTIKQKAAQRSFHNTELLLTNYRKFSWMLSYFPENVAKELDLPFENSDSLMSALDVECARGNAKLENRLRSYLPLREQMDRLNEAVTLLKNKPDNGETLYKIIYYKYIADETITIDELCKRLYISRGTYSKMRKEALSWISFRLWGTNDKSLSFIMETISFIQTNS